MQKLKSQKPHIGIFGRRNVGKSSFINALTNQEIAIVSDVKGTTTDAVYKTIELGDVGPVVIVDTAGIDDEGTLGEKRIEVTKEVLKRVDLSILITDKNVLSSYENKLIADFARFDVPFLVVKNKSDMVEESLAFHKEVEKTFKTKVVEFSAHSSEHLEKDNLIKEIRKILPKDSVESNTIVGDLVKSGDLVVLVTPVDKEAPEGRLILPQVRTIRDLLDNNCVTVVVKERELDLVFSHYQMKPALVITDSQAFLKVSASVPNGVPLTSFSILFARLKGDFDLLVKGTRQITKLKDHDKVLILESCTHHVQGDDIGRVKIPRWLTQFTGKELDFTVVPGVNKIPEDLESYSLVIQCGGCMLTRKQVLNRLKPAIEKGIAVSNYGMVIGLVHGSFERAIEPFGYHQESEI